MPDQYWDKSGASSIFVRAGLRTSQFTFSIVTAALYGVDLASSSSRGTRAESAWVYAEVVAALSALTCVVHCFVTVKRVLWCIWVCL